MINVIVVKNNKIIRNVIRNKKSEAKKIFENFMYIYCPSFSKYTREWVEFCKEKGYCKLENNIFIEISWSKRDLGEL